MAQDLDKFIQGKLIVGKQWRGAQIYTIAIVGNFMQKLPIMIAQGKIILYYL
ncbi:hypothetical protein [Candidatus Uabimicrobium amorphum]|uniref:hypothetical protein n=1 Tax=Uabimicrobium amorphum TaxID=2596890 RepID=UPI00156646DA|nr:hypothetical protein [Candidatus Uabimicrobium amorphum]